MSRDICEVELYDLCPAHLPKVASLTSKLFVIAIGVLICVYFGTILLRRIKYAHLMNRLVCLGYLVFGYKVDVLLPTPSLFRTIQFTSVIYNIIRAVLLTMCNGYHPLIEWGLELACLVVFGMMYSALFEVYFRFGKQPTDSIFDFLPSLSHRLCMIGGTTLGQLSCLRAFWLSPFTKQSCRTQH